ncbi:extracellular catalytic domain type 1 short-chain-length polyhydroxyalkanoate depolymerase [Undibacterium terreum]|uniref:Depolymerase n=1 Tax=Undibacterium terreum TaxID=1224302 RepID=A0A916XFB7_9BURK|nr:PHB depolymerase family esterase [Undibacterium terreum]GGC66428.1 depolymerase [Undibacterium terreum]
MLKAFGRSLWKSIARAARTQQRTTKKLATALLASASPAKRPARKKASAKKTSPGKVASSRAQQTKSKPKAQAGPAPLPGKWLASYYTQVPDAEHSGTRRLAYWLYIPQREHTGKLPLVVMLHGCGQSATQFATGSRMNQVAEEQGFAVLYPQQSLRGHANRCWPWYDKRVQEGGGETLLLSGLIDKVVQSNGLDETRIYAAGLSAGAGMAHILALALPDKIAAVGLHSGPVFGAGHTAVGAYSVMQHGSAKAAAGAIKLLPNPQANMPAILLQGLADKIVRPINQAQLAQQFITMNRLDAAHAMPLRSIAAGRTKTHPRHAHQILDYRIGRKTMLRVCAISGLEHAWSGGDCSAAFSACEGPDASKMMWDFFKQHRKPALRAAQRPTVQDGLDSTSQQNR